MQQFFPPCEKDLKKIKILWDWKEYYEKRYANDIADIFKKDGSDYFKADVDIRKEDREGKHPLINELGDYDVIGLDTSKEKNYLIECKVLQPIDTVYEHIHQQKRFFLEKKYDEKFQNRIDYFRGISKEFFMRKGFDVHKYAILSYMVVYKPFESYYKDVSFDLVTVDELKKLIDANYY